MFLDFLGVPPKTTVVHGNPWCPPVGAMFYKRNLVFLSQVLEGRNKVRKFYTSAKLIVDNLQVVKGYTQGMKKLPSYMGIIINHN